MAKNFGIIGCGMIAVFHAKAIKAAGGKLVACFDRIQQASERITKKYGGKAYHDLYEFLADPDLEIVTIGTPSGAHCEFAIAAAEAGKHVIVEKPLEITLLRCDKIIAECQKAGVILSTIFPSRFHDSSIKIKKAIETGRFGKLTVGDAIVKWHRTQDYYDSGAWRGTWELDGGGALMNQAIHSVDLLTWLMGPIVEVNANISLLAHERIAVEDTAVATVRFQSGALGIIEATTSVYPGYLKRIEVHGSQGSAVMEEEDIIKWDFATSIEDDAEIREAMLNRLSGGGGAADPAAIGHHGHAKQFKDVMDAINNNRQPAIDGTEGRRSVEIILAIYEAAEKRATIKLPLTADPILKFREKGVLQ